MSPAAASLLRRLARGLGGVVLLLWLSAGAVPAQAGERIWAGLVLASQARDAQPPPPELGRVAMKIEKFFGYNQLELIGAASKELREGGEHWLVPSQHFWMSVVEKHGFEEGHLLNVTLFHDKRQLVETEAKVSPMAPLIMRGPVHARGQLIFVVQIVK